MSRWRLAILLLTGCHKLFGLTQVDDPPAGPDDGGSDARRACGHRDVAAGKSHTCAIDAAGDVYCWGNNEHGQVLPGGELTVDTPAKIDLKPGAAVQVAAGRGVSCARYTDGSVWCWGDNELGELGQGVTGDPLGPQQIDLGGERASDVDIGAFHVCVRRESDGALLCWGDNRTGAVGNGAPGTSPLTTPTLVAGSLGMTQLSVGHRHSCAIDTAGLVRCWGKGEAGQLGQGTSSTGALTTASGITNATRVSAGGRGTCAIAGGVATCWGDNTYGQLGDGTRDSHAAPGLVATSDTLDIGLSAEGACALKLDGTLRCWGTLLPGDGTFSSSLLPRQNNISGASALAVGFWHTCVIDGGEVLCWGENDDGQLGRGARDVTAIPVAVTIPGSVTRVVAGKNHACATSSTGVYCWGDNPYGQLGNGTHSSTHEIVEVSTGLANITGIAATDDHTCAWNGTAARCWGLNGGGVLGAASPSFDAASPVSVVAAGAVTAMGLGGQHTCAITTGTTVRCWGRNNHGQLGNNSTTDSAGGVDVSAGTVQQVVAGNGHTCARKSDTTLVCWGLNDHGQVGNNGTTDVLAPTQVQTAVSDVAAGKWHTCAIAGGQLYCWGDNEHGQLGVGDTLKRAQPTSVTLPSPPVDVEAGGSSTCVRLADASTMCWGDGFRGQLASGTNVANQTTPLLAPQLANSEALSIATDGGCGLSGSAVRCWGAFPLLGDGNVASAEPGPTLLPCPPPATD